MVSLRNLTAARFHSAAWRQAAARYTNRGKPMVSLRNLLSLAQRQLRLEIDFDHLLAFHRAAVLHRRREAHAMPCAHCGVVERAFGARRLDRSLADDPALVDEEPHLDPGRAARLRCFRILELYRS